MDALGWGKTLICVGVFGLLASMAMDTSVETGMGGRVNNLGLMKDQQNYITISLGVMIVGAIMLLRRQSVAVTDGAVSPSRATDSKPCPECAEHIMRDAKVCRFCGNRDFPEAVELPYEPAIYEHRRKKKTLFEKLFWSSADPNHPANKK